MTEVMDHVPDGWKVLNAIGHPHGYRFISNGKSRFGPDYQHALVPEEVAYEWCDRTRQTDGQGAE